MLITSHMLFVGFSLNDDNFYRVADGVKKALKVRILLPRYLTLGETDQPSSSLRHQPQSHFEPILRRSLEAAAQLCQHAPTSALTCGSGLGQGSVRSFHSNERIRFFVWANERTSGGVSRCSSTFFNASLASTRPPSLVAWLATDTVLFLCSSWAAHIMDPRFSAALNPAEEKLRHAVQAFQLQMTPE
jgi:hypothetical protein